MKREQARAIGLFFLLGLMEERVAIAAASRAIAKLKAEFSEISRRDREQESVSIAAVMRVCRESWKVHRKMVPRNRSVLPPSVRSDSTPGVWTLPKTLDLSVWMRYQKDASDDDVMAVLFSIVLGFTDHDLADGFNTSVGTIRYRLGKGVRQLGLVARGAQA